jgi:hypothetical protein
MRRIITLVLSIFLTLNLFGQRLDYDHSSNWFLGLNVGAAWNTTDVKNKTDIGYGFLFGRTFNYREGNRLSFDLRMRYLRGKWYGQDYDSTNLAHLGTDYTGSLAEYQADPGFTVNNFEADVHELGFELAIHANRFVNRTGWDPYIFGGVNLVWNTTSGDLVDQANFLGGDANYAYDSLSLSKPTIDAALDGIYETALDGSTGTYDVDFMPSLGIGLGYQFGPRFSMGVEHKTTFTRQDLFDGYDAGTGTGIFKNDMFHYTSAYMRFRLGGRNRVRPTRPATVPVNPVTTNVAPCQNPVIRLVRPNQRSINSLTQFYVLKTEVRYVAGRNNIILSVNGSPTTNFLYNPSTHMLEANLQLVSGNNTIEIVGNNGCGSDREVITLVYDDCEEPRVAFENVCGNNGADVENAAYNVLADVENAATIYYTVNGVSTTNYTYNATTDQFSSNITLQQGQNTIQITATNDCGTDTETIVVTYTNCAEPYINFFSGNTTVIQVSDANYNLQAYVFNVTSRNQITFKVNGVSKSFNFNTSSSILQSNLNLNPGQNVIAVTATNSCGTDTEVITIQYTPCIDPIIQMILPAGGTASTNNGSQLVSAKLFNISSMSQIQLLVNGVVQYGGTFNAITKIFEETVALNSGTNTIQIIATNSCGTDTETITLGCVPCDAPDVQLILPANGGFTANPSQLVQALIFNATALNQISVYVNGVLQTGGTFSVASGLYQNSVSLIEGVNTIQVSATNSCGTNSESVTITHRPCQAPIISFTAPTSSPLYTTAATFNVAATVVNVTAASQIQMTVNGILDASGAGFNSGTSTYSNSINLNAGANVIKIVATNSCGTVTQEVIVIREIVIIEIPSEEVDSIVICRPHLNNVGNPETITIPLSAWPAYQAQGAILGPCPIEEVPEDRITICHRPPGNPTNTQTLTIPLSAWAAHQAHGDVLGECPPVETPEETITVCLDGSQLEIGITEWANYQAQGAILGDCPEQTMIICLNGNEQEIPVTKWADFQAQGATQGPCPEENVTMCLNGNPVEVPTSQIGKFESQGAVLGPCPETTTTICLNGQQMVIPVSQLASNLAQGALEGPCPEETATMCLNGSEIEIPVSQIGTYEAQGAVLGACPEVMMTICLNGNQQEIRASKWADFQAQGATQGPCPEENVTMCLNGNPVEVPTSQIGKFESQGAVLGPCPETTTTICLNGQQMVIPLSQWAQYQAQGAILGACREVTAIVCLNGMQLTIPVSQLASHLAQGAVEGPCAEENVTMCLNGSEIEIPISQIGKFEAQGAVLGACAEAMMTICLNGNQQEIPVTKWADFQAQGATQGPCPEENVTMCLNGNSVEVPTSQIGKFQSQGAILGPCPVIIDPDPTMTICLDGNEQEIPVDKWPNYQAQGATQGPCVGTGVITDTTSMENEIEGGIERPGFGEQTITICFTPEGELNSRTMEIPLSEWGTYQANGASLGPCASGGGLNEGDEKARIEAEAKAKADAAAKVKADAAAKAKRDAAAKVKADAAAKAKRDAAAKVKADAAAKAKRDAAAKVKADAAAKAKRDAAAKVKADAAAKAKRDAAAKVKADAAAKAKRDAAAKVKADAAAKAKIDAAAKVKADAAAKVKKEKAEEEKKAKTVGGQ